MAELSGISVFGKKFSEDTGIMHLMDDMARAIAMPGEKSMFGGGNPAVVEAVVEAFQSELSDIASSGPKFIEAFSNYDTPQGNQKFIAAFVTYMNKKYDWGITEKNVVVTPGSQAGFFALFNLLAGEQTDGSHKKIVFPIVPEYIGYADQGVGENIFYARRPDIETHGAHAFKYHANFDALEEVSDAAAFCVSRPSNPSGNVVSDNELAELHTLAKNKGVPLIVDCAYGQPFPGVMEHGELPKWEDSLVYSFSLSKIGLPGVRNGIFVASEEIVQRLTSMNAILSLANSNIGQVLVTNLLVNGKIDELATEYIQPFYAEREERARSILVDTFDSSLPYRLHEYEGSYFYWLWLQDLPITSKELYERLKKRGVVVVPGEYFFPGLDEPWGHTQQCLRLNFSRPDDELERGYAIMAEEIAKAYVN